MVWARTKLLIWDYVFEPVKNINIAYSGKNPESLYKKLNELIRTVFNVPEAYVQEKNYKWDMGKEVQSFEVSWELTKIYDKFTHMVVEVVLKGATDGKTGKATIAIKPRMITEYPQDTVWQQNLFYEIMRRFWHSAFYHRQRMEYLDTSKELCVGFESAIKNSMEELRK